MRNGLLVCVVAVVAGCGGKTETQARLDACVKGLESVITAGGQLNLNAECKALSSDELNIAMKIATERNPGASFNLRGEGSPADKPAPPASPSNVSPTKNPEPVDLRMAIATARPFMEDVHDAPASKGAAILAIWGASNMTWSDLQTLDVGKYALVMKDSASQRGKRICLGGTIIEIGVDRTAGEPLYVGGMYDEAGKIYRFIAVGSTGELVENSRAKFCGVVTGQMHYSNSVGGVAHSVQLVGMFDLPANRAN